jgi:hypothetical protein
MSVFAPLTLPHRLALGFSPSQTPGLLFVALGVVLGPSVMDAVSITVLAQLDPIVSMALAVLGVFIGAGFAAKRHAPAALVGALGQAALTFGGVTLTMWLLLERWQMPLPVSVMVAAITLGLCSAASAAIYPVGGRSPQMSEAATLADLDDVPIILVASVVVPWFAGVTSWMMTLMISIVGAIVVATAGVLLLSRAAGAPERGVVITGTALLLGGTAAYANASPLLTGLLAGMLWTRLTPTAGVIGSDLRRLQHPLLALLMITAGATIQWSWALLWLTAPLVLVRLAGKTLGGLVFARVASLPAGLLSTVLLPPGVLGIALALNVHQVIGGGDALLVSAVTASTMASEVVARLVLSSEDVR